MHNRDSNNKSKNHLTPTMENNLKAIFNRNYSATNPPQADQGTKITELFF